jgi:hypothetical protein
MNWHRFLAYTVLGCWIGLTAVIVGTALQWSAARSASQIKIQRALNEQKEASASEVGNVQRDVDAGLEDRAVAAESQRNHERLLLKAEDASEAMADAINLEEVARKQFWWQFGVWGGLTLLASALLAERYDGGEKPLPRK